MCGKTGFLTKGEAERALRAPMRSVRAWTAKVPCRAYECPRCKLYHLTAMPLQAFQGATA
jgi:hypothetical protein